MTGRNQTYYSILDDYYDPSDDLQGTPSTTRRCRTDRIPSPIIDAIIDHLEPYAENWQTLVNLLYVSRATKEAASRIIYSKISLDSKNSESIFSTLLRDAKSDDLHERKSSTLIHLKELYIESIPSVSLSIKLRRYVMHLTMHHHPKTSSHKDDYHYVFPILKTITFHPEAIHQLSLYAYLNRDQSHPLISFLSHPYTCSPKKVIYSIYPFYQYKNKYLRQFISDNQTLNRFSLPDNHSTLYVWDGGKSKEQYWLEKFGEYYMNHTSSALNNAFISWSCVTEVIVRNYRTGKIALSQQGKVRIEFISIPCNCKEPHWVYNHRWKEIMWRDDCGCDYDEMLDKRVEDILYIVKSKFGGRVFGASNALSASGNDDIQNQGKDIMVAIDEDLSDGFTSDDKNDEIDRGTLQKIELVDVQKGLRGHRKVYFQKHLIERLKKVIHEDIMNQIHFTRTD